VSQAPGRASGAAGSTGPAEALSVLPVTSVVSSLSLGFMRRTLGSWLRGCRATFVRKAGGAWRVRFQGD
jgi:hypothetical protein